MNMNQGNQALIFEGENPYSPPPKKNSLKTKILLAEKTIILAKLLKISNCEDR